MLPFEKMTVPYKKRRSSGCTFSDLQKNDSMKLIVVLIKEKKEQIKRSEGDCNG